MNNDVPARDRARAYQFALSALRGVIDPGLWRFKGSVALSSDLLSCFMLKEFGCSKSTLPDVKSKHSRGLS